jgi:hypothetical protein
MPGTQVKDDPAATATGTNGADAKPAVKRRTTASAPAPAAALTIKPIRQELLAIRIIGTAPLIVSRFSEKAKAQMLAAQQGKKRQPEKRDPHREYLASLYRAGVDPATEEVLFGLPAMAFKMATIGAGRFWGKQVKMTELRQFLTFYGVSVPSEAGRMVVLDGRPRMREDYVRLAGVNHPADLRYRGCFYRWSATLMVGYTSNLLERDSVVSLIEAGGGNVGVGEWRPERNGEFGTFRIADGRNAVTVVRELDPMYLLDSVDYDVYGEEDHLTMDDFAELDAPPEVLAEEPEPEPEAKPVKDKEPGPDRGLTAEDRAAMAAEAGDGAGSGS